MKLSDGTEIGMSLETIATPGHNLLPCPEGMIWYHEFRISRSGKNLPAKVTNEWRQVPLPKTAYEARHCVGVVRKINGKPYWAGFSLGEVSERNFQFPPQDWLNFQEWLNCEDSEKFLLRGLELCREQHATNIKAPVPRLSHEELEPYPRIFWPYLVRLPNATIGVTGFSASICPQVRKMFEQWASYQESIQNLHN